MHPRIIKNLLNRICHLDNNQDISLTRRMRIKKISRNLISGIMYYSGLSLVWYWAFARKRVRILTYHEIQTRASNSSSVSVSNFQKEMEYVKSNCSVISLRAFEKYLQGNISLQSDSIVITFDDGYKSFYDIAYPILKQYQLPATCFLVTTKVNGNDDLFMHWDEVKEITRHGLITIGSHTISHKSLSAVDDLQLENEIRESKILIENNLKIPIHYFSYPYGTPRDIDERCFQALANSGYKLSCTSINGVNSRNTTRLRLRRTKIEWGDGLNTFKKILHGALDIWVVIDYVSGFLLRKRESTERGQEFLGV